MCAYTNLYAYLLYISIQELLSEVKHLRRENLNMRTQTKDPSRHPKFMQPTRKLNGRTEQEYQVSWSWDGCQEYQVSWSWDGCLSACVV